MIYIGHNIKKKLKGDKMKIIPNIPAAVKLLGDVKYFNKNKARIEAAKAAGDFEEERKWILDSTATF